MCSWAAVGRRPPMRVRPPPGATAVILRWPQGVPSCVQRAASSSSQSKPVDHYEVLGVPSTATPKEIKAAYYKMSKEHHPDTNPDDKERATRMFAQVAESYEVLSSPERRRQYDATRARPAPYTRAAGDPRDRQYYDLDLDYKNFEAFQKNARRRQQRRESFVYEWPDEFSDGSRPVFRPREFRSVFDEATERVAAHKDSRAQRREMEELRREMEREQERIAKRYPMPTFEQMLREKEAKEAKEQRQYLQGLLGVMLAGSVLFLIYKS